MNNQEKKGDAIRITGSGGLIIEQSLKVVRKKRKKGREREGGPDKIAASITRADAVFYSRWRYAISAYHRERRETREKEEKEREREREREK